MSCQAVTCGSLTAVSGGFELRQGGDAVHCQYPMRLRFETGLPCVVPGRRRRLLVLQKIERQF